MNRRAIVGMVRTTAAVGALLAVGGSVAQFSTGNAGLWWLEVESFDLTIVVFFAVFVWLAIPHQPRNRVLWLIAGSSFAFGLSIASLAVVAGAAPDPDLLRETTLAPTDLPSKLAWILLIKKAMADLGFLSLITLGILLFPDGRLPSRRWRWVAALAVLGILTAVLDDAWSWRPGSTLSPERGPLDEAGLLITGVAAVLSVVALVVRFRGSSGATRQQLKWIAWGAAPTVVVATLLAAFVNGGPYQHLLPLPATMGGALFVSGYGIAVARYRLYDIDRIISRTLAYAILTAVLGGAYVGLLFVLGTALRPLTADSDLAVAASVLAVAALFNPLRRRVQSVVDRRFNRSRYDAEQTVEAFSERLRQEIDLETLTDELTEVVDETMQPTRVALWLNSRATPR